MSRSGLKISKYSDSENTDCESKEQLSPMISQFAKAVIPASAVEQARARNAQSVFQQLSSIINSKPRYATVDDAVKDMCDRTGLHTYLDNIKIADSKKKVSNAASDIPESLKQYDFCEDIVNYIRNMIKNKSGLGVSIPQIQHDVFSLFGIKGLNSKDLINEDVAKFINDCIYNERKMLPDSIDNHNIGKDVGKDLEENTDPWAGLIPSK